MTVLRVRQVVAPNIALMPISRSCELPNTCNKQGAIRRGAKHISLNQHEAILEEISRREALDYDEEVRTVDEDDRSSCTLSSSDDDDENSADSTGMNDCDDDSDDE
jgi:hypothetical protein